MPIIRHGGQVIHFAHVPKCAGTAVVRYITNRTGPMAFWESRFFEVPARDRWTKSSPQHVPLAVFDRLFPPGFFDARFAVVRHPVDRMAAVYLFQLEKEGSVSPETAFEDWLRALPDLPADQPFLFDNHTRPMVDFVPPEAAVFRMEDGLDRVQAWIDDRLGLAPDPEHPQIPRINTRYRRLGGKVPEFGISAEARALVERLFATDFERFGYDT